MNKLIMSFSVLFICICCKGQIKESKRSIVTSEEIEIKETVKDTLSLQEFKLEKDKGRSYEEVRKSVETKRKELRSKDELDSLSRQFKESLLHRVIPFWEGTMWSFEGHTSQPQKGEIACGYFVSTTLKHIGLNINRYQLAQQSPINEAKSLVLESEILIFEEETVEENIRSITEKLPEGIHFIGFDESHVGYILKEKERLCLIHSNYTGKMQVEIEPIERSTVFKSYSKFYIVPLSTNKSLLKKWIHKEEIIIVKK